MKSILTMVSNDEPSITVQTFAIIVCCVGFSAFIFAAYVRVAQSNQWDEEHDAGNTPLWHKINKFQYLYLIPLSASDLVSDLMWGFILFNDEDAPFSYIGLLSILCVFVLFGYNLYSNILEFAKTVTIYTIDMYSYFEFWCKKAYMNISSTGSLNNMCNEINTVTMITNTNESVSYVNVLENMTETEFSKILQDTNNSISEYKFIFVENIFNNQRNITITR